MKLSELTKIVAESEQKDAFDKWKLTIKLPHLNYLVNLVGIVGIYEYFLRQQKLFYNYEKLPPELERVKDAFNSIITFIATYVVNPGSGGYDLKNSLSFFERNTSNIFLPDTAEFEFLVDVFLRNNEYYAGAFQFLSGQLNNTSSKPHMMGYMMAYEFLTKNTSLITERKNAEEKSIATIRNEFQESLAKAHQYLTDYLEETKKQSEENSKSITEFKKGKEAEFYKWYDKSVKEFDAFAKISDQKIKDLETLYEEKLKLEAPAQYWSKRADTLRKDGRKWLCWLIGTVVVGIGLLTTVLILITTGDLQKIFEKTATAIKWSVVFITLVSFIAFAIRIFSKLTFSSYHLVRDAEEREQLTYVYLALQKEKGIDQTERQLIMQSIFSRADSGLLKDEAAPTMPGNILNQITSR